MSLCLARLHKVNNGDWKQSVAFIAIPANCSFHWTDDAVADIFPRLWFRKVIAGEEEKEISKLS